MDLDMEIPNESAALELRAGELVQVKTAEEILVTLGEQGALDKLPFMPEMLQFCGKRFKVFKRAHKTCDTINYTGARHMADAVHLDGVRCDGNSHGGCQAGCLIFWKEAWLKRVSSNEMNDGSTDPIPMVANSDKQPSKRALPICTEDSLLKATRVMGKADEHDGQVYSCQATDLLVATNPLPWWDFRQYWEDVRSGNVKVWDVIEAFIFRVFSKILKLGAYRLQLYLYNRIQSFRGATPYPFKFGNQTKTPSSSLNLQSGELVLVKSQDEILETVNSRNRNRGLSFDPEMVSFCGKEFRVLRRVEQIIDEKTGKMIHINSDCVMLDGVTCPSRYSNHRLFCPRSSYHYWREIWLKRPV